MSKLAFWNRGPVAIVTKTQDGVLNIAPATAAHSEDLTFTTEQLKSLFATLKASGLPVRSKALALYGEKGRITPEITEADKKTGEEWPYAYTAKQIASFDAKGVIVKEAWNGRAYAPLVMCFLVAKEKAKVSAPFSRVNVEGEGNIKADPREKSATRKTQRVNVEE